MLVEIVNEKKKRPIVFPCLMEHTSTHTIVLFTDKKIGTVLAAKDRLYDVGYYSYAWTMEGFYEFEGSVKLSNDESVSED